MNLYEILNIDHDASTSNIKKAYHKLAKKYHPDKFKGSDAKFKNINFAYEILSNEELRKNYDSKNIDENAYDLIQKIIKNNNLELVNDFFNFLYTNKSELKEDINNLNFFNLYEKVKSKNNLDIIKEEIINIEDIYFNKNFELNVRRIINKKFYDFKLDVNIDIYDEELTFENMGDEIFLLNGNLILKIKLKIDNNYSILDNYNLLVEVKNLNFKLFNKIELQNLNLEIYNNNLYIVRNYGFFNKESNNKGDLYIKII